MGDLNWNARCVQGALEGTPGSWLVLKLLDRTPAARFWLIFLWVVTLLALRLLRQASGL